MKTEHFLSNIKEAIDVALFKLKAMHHVATDKNKTVPAFIIIALGGVAWVLGLKFSIGYSPTILKSLLMVFYHLVVTTLGIYVLSYVAKSIFKGSAKHDEFFRVLAFSMIVAWMLIFPALSIIVGLWGLALLFSILKSIHKLTTGGAIFVTLLAFGLLKMILSPVLAPFGFDIGRDYKKEFKMNFNNEEGSGSVEMKDGKMTIKGPNGEAMEIEIPDQE